jgi:uncharacterized protein YjeT (DUF2065 family)
VLSVAIRGIAGIVFGLLGLIGLFFPDRTRRFISRFLEKTPVRILGVVLMALGAGVFRVATQLQLPVLSQVLGVLLFMFGGVHIFIPEFAIILNEWWVARKTLWERLVSLGYIGLAVLFFMPQEGFPKFWQVREPVPEEFRQSPPLPETADPSGNAGETTPEKSEAPDAPAQER